ncbi:hypothetical protein DKG34_22095 [Streptomyces sp. NWU49]|nr:hypothetical protein DKG34_22095 [Streptomyces sp. NWU49]
MSVAGEFVVRLIGLVGCGGPGGEQFEAVGRWDAGLGAQCGEGQAGVGGDGQGLEGEDEVADGGVVEAFEAGVVQAYVVCDP